MKWMRFRVRTTAEAEDILISEMEEIGLDDCLYGGGVTVIEWAERIEELLPADTVRVTIGRMPENPDYRSIRMEAEDPEEIAKLLTE
jgi:tRNA A37 threonylcarbamoyladenosine biosynthesis protein TsaE